jgi:hypothetical protein
MFNFRAIGLSTDADGLNLRSTLEIKENDNSKVFIMFVMEKHWQDECYLDQSLLCFRDDQSFDYSGSDFEYLKKFDISPFLDGRS